VGLRIARNRKTGRYRYHRVDGAEGTLDAPAWGLLDFPGAQQPLAISSPSDIYKPVVARDPDTGAVLWQVWRKNVGFTDTDPTLAAAGTRLVPPAAFWHFLTPRDPAGSRVLRQIGEDTVRRLLTAAATSEEALRTAVRGQLPGITHPLLVQGVAGIFQEAAAKLVERDAMVTEFQRTP
jgi:hypothetical protein